MTESPLNSQLFTLTRGDLQQNEHLLQVLTILPDSHKRASVQTRIRTVSAKHLCRVFLIFSARQWRTILSCAHSAQETFFKGPDSCQKEVTSFPILNPDTVYGPSFTSAGADHQPYQIRFIILIFILLFAARTIELNLWDKDKFVLELQLRCSWYQGCAREHTLRIWASVPWVVPELPAGLCRGDTKDRTKTRWLSELSDSLIAKALRNSCRGCPGGNFGQSQRLHQTVPAVPRTFDRHYLCASVC